MHVSSWVKNLSMRQLVPSLMAAALALSLISPAVSVNAAGFESAPASTGTAAVSDRLMAKDTAAKTIELETAGVVQLADDYKVEQHLHGKVLSKSLSQVMIGARNLQFEFNGDNKVSRIIMNGHEPVQTMRIGLRKNISDISDNSQFNHTLISFKSVKGYTISDKKSDSKLTVPAGELATFTVSGGQLSVTYPSATAPYTTKNRLYLTPNSDDSLLQAMSYTRAQGNPLYRGTIEISLNADNTTMKLLNEVTIEQYLYQVVPSEMPASFGLEALRAQAIAARTYALTDYYSNRFADRGIHIDDSTLSQVYNNSAENALTTQAVNDTAGKIMKSGEELVDARFYSTSGGYGASKHEVWSDTAGSPFPGTPIPYLVARSYTYDPNDETKILEIDTSDEAQLNAFYKNLGLKGYDSESYYFRWKVGLTKTELENTINANLKVRHGSDPTSILTKNEQGMFVSKTIPDAGIGSFKDMYVTKRGAGGNIVELVIEGTTGTYKILKEYNVRFTIRPSKTYTLGSDVVLHRAQGNSTDYAAGYKLLNPSILNSAFFSFDIDKNGAGEPTGVTFFGGGNGHGVGMSQYGASMLGGKGWTYSQILNSYYANMRIVDMNEPVPAYIDLQGSGQLSKGQKAQAVVTAVYTDGSTWPIAAGVNYSSSDESVVTISGTGEYTAKQEGTAVLTAKHQGFTASLTVQVTPPVVESLRLTGLNPIRVGETLQAEVSALYTDGTEANVTSGAAFASSDEAIATVAASGMVTGAAYGTTVISAFYEGKTATYTLEVLKPEVNMTGITLSGAASLEEGTTGDFTVQASYNDGTTAALTDGVTFESTATEIAAISATGTVSAWKSGTTVIRAVYSTYEAEQVLTVVPPALQSISISSPAEALRVGETFTMTVRAFYSNGTDRPVTEGVAFDSSHPEVAAIDADGTITAIAPGTTVIRADYEGQSKEYALEVLAEEVTLTGIAITGAASLEEGSSTQTKVTGKYSNGSEAVLTEGISYESSSPTVASVSQTGLVRALNPGSATITATAATYGGLTASYQVQVYETSGSSSSSGSSGSSAGPAPGTTPSVEQALTAGKDGTAVIDAKAATSVKLPGRASELLGSGTAEVNFAGVKIAIPSKVLEQLQKGLTGTAASDASIVLEAKPVSGETASALLTGSGRQLNAVIRPAGDIIDFSLSIQAGSQTFAPKQFDSPLKVTFGVQGSPNKKRTGVFQVKEDGSLERAAGTWSRDGSAITAELLHFSKYAVLEVNKTFEDMKGHWAAEVVADLAAGSIVQGQSNSLYGPEQLVSRAEFSAMLVRALGLKASGSAAFADVPDDAWYAGEVAAAFRAGLVLGTSDTTFSPDAKLNREQMAVMLARAWEHQAGKKLPAADGSAFIDEEELSGWSRDSVLSLAEAKLLNGRDGGRFEPQAFASRAEVAKVLHGLLDMQDK
ncbi:SpoIID/LytB domain protein [Paenibacillus sp. UNCCL117]|uniref:SpoIID/LytB domain-containing protein n=1 Tax=unclassified Paenibacillus TaxID=185978 RepID=UPI00088AD0DC|nr:MULTISPECIES: SpoIID/LytB domain-containing protein [unclassified Paenibacillus]SDE28925.1 SpoIID/LytB domain protein [Paenibacillus sp. cl123]SFW63371.1 SpoIID/LytB domain protein [Paenibacillus sp. UNCCL117]